MQSTDQPALIPIPFAQSGGRSVIPNTSQIGVTDGAASWPDGFPPLTRTPPASGGVPPSGLEMNGILWALSANLRWWNAGGAARRDSAFQSSIGGYHNGAVLQSSDNVGAWRSTADNNTTDPEAGGAGWEPLQGYGALSITMASSNVTVTPLQALRHQIVLTGTLGANVTLFMPATRGEWTILNRTTGNFTITARTATGTGVVLLPGTNVVFGDGANILHQQALSSAINTNGYRITPDGLIEQWGSVAVTPGDNGALNTITFPIPFRVALYNLTGNADRPANNDWGPVVVLFPAAGRTLNTATVLTDTTNEAQNLQSGINVNWRALGR